MVSDVGSHNFRSACRASTTTCNPKHNCSSLEEIAVQQLSIEVLLPKSSDQEYCCSKLKSRCMLLIDTVWIKGVACLRFVSEICPHKGALGFKKSIGRKTIVHACREWLIGNCTLISRLGVGMKQKAEDGDYLMTPLYLCPMTPQRRVGCSSFLRVWTF